MFTLVIERAALRRELDVGCQDNVRTIFIREREPEWRGEVGVGGGGKGNGGRRRGGGL